MRWVKLKTHASGNLSARTGSRIRFTSKNGWHEISGASACRCQGCWPRPMYGTSRWFVELEKFLKEAFHIVDDDQDEFGEEQVERAKKFSRLRKWRSLLSSRSTTSWLSTGFPSSSCCHNVKQIHQHWNPQPSVHAKCSPCETAQRS